MTRTGHNERAARIREQIARRHSERVERVETRAELPPEILDAIATLTSTVLALKAELSELQADHGRIKSLLVRIGEEAEKRGAA